MRGAGGQKDDAAAHLPAYDESKAMLPDELAALLADSPGTLKSILEHMPAGLGYFAADGTLLGHNAELTRLLGGLPRRAAEIRFRVPGAPENVPENGAAGSTPVTRALAGETVRGEDLEVLQPGGTARWVKLSAFPVPANGGAVAVLLDVGEIASLGHVRDQIMGVVAHDLRNPLSALRMTATMLGKGQEMTTTRRHELAERMLGTISRMEALVASLVEHAQSEKGIELKLQREQVDLDEVFTRIKRDLDVLFPGRTVQLTRRGRVDGQWDASRISRVMCNLLVNALKHGGDDHPVSLTLDGTADDVVCITVHNRGNPIAPDFLPRAFQPFTIGAGASEPRRRTIGLGLFAVEHLVRAHGGTVSAASSAEEGTTFIVTLPRS
jgi:signal transduction histidine kinase